MKVPISVWSFAAVGFAGVFLLSGYVTSKFNEAQAQEDQALSSSYAADSSVASPVLGSVVEQNRILQWIKKNNLNQFGDAMGTTYLNGGPLSDGGTKIYIDKFHYIMVKHPDRPWNTGTPYDEHAMIDAWIKTNNLNQYGDAQGTMYPGSTPLFDKITGQTIDRYVYIEQKFPDRPWAKVAQTT